jgi:Kef-type K+ transport system membrane component KefB
VPVLADAGMLHRPVGVLTVACASAGEVASVVALSVGVAGSHTPLAGRVLLLGLLVALLGAVAAGVGGAEHVGRITALVDGLADTSAQIRIRLTVLLVAGIAPAAATLGFEAILGRSCPACWCACWTTPSPSGRTRAIPSSEAVGFGLLIPVFFVTTGITLDVTGLIDSARHWRACQILLLALLIVRGAPAIVFRCELTCPQLVATSLLQATSVRFLLTVAQIGIEMGLLAHTTAAALVTAGLASVLIFPPVALQVLTRSNRTPSQADAVVAVRLSKDVRQLHRRRTCTR